MGGAIAVSRSLASLRYQTSPTDTATLATTAAVLGLAGVAGAWLPARRVMRVDPVRALRAE